MTDPVRFTKDIMWLTFLSKLGSTLGETNCKEDGEPCKEKGSRVVFKGEFFAPMWAVFAVS